MEWIKRSGENSDDAEAKRRWEMTGFGWLKRSCRQCNDRHGGLPTSNNKDQVGKPTTEKRRNAADNWAR